MDQRSQPMSEPLSTSLTRIRTDQPSTHRASSALATDDRPSAMVLREIAQLTTDDVMQMHRHELIDTVLRVRRQHLRPGVRTELYAMDGETLRRLVFATRRFCEGQLGLCDLVDSDTFYPASPK